MTSLPRHPRLYEINTRVWLNSLRKRLGKRLTLSQVPASDWNRFKDLGMDLLWLMGVWTPSPVGTRIAREHPGLEQEYRRALPDLQPADVVGSPYAIADYHLNPMLGTDEDLLRVRQILNGMGLGLILDFVPNHTARDHPWVTLDPERYVCSDSPDTFGHGGSFPVTSSDGKTRWIAHGRDPYFPPWSDTAQLFALGNETRKGLREELLRIARLCDGVRCDMAMLVLNRIFEQTWGSWMEATGKACPRSEFWPELLVPLKDRFPSCLLLGEVYWELERELLNLGFDYVYDKAGYDRLRAQDPQAYKDGLRREGTLCERRIRFLENHDEDRLASVFPPEALRSAAVVHATTPGLRLFHHGQLDGRKIKLPVQLARAPQEETDPDLAAFYRKLLALTNVTVLREGEGCVLEVSPAFEGDLGYEAVIGFGYKHREERAVVAVNYSGREASGYLRFPEGFWAEGERVQLLDRLAEPEVPYERSTDDLVMRGLYVRLPPFGFHLLMTPP